MLADRLPPALRERGFAALWLAETVSRLGDGIHEVAILWLVYDVTENPVLLSLVVIASVVPSIVVSMPAGVIVDRFHRTRVMIAANVVRGGAVLAIPAVGHSEHLVAVVAVVAVVASTMEAFFHPARNALVPNLVDRDHLDSANSLLQMTESASKILYAAGGIVVGVFGSFAAFYVDAASFLVAAGLLVMVPASAGATDQGDDDSTLFGSMASDIVGGLRYVRHHSVLVYVMLLWTLTGLSFGPLGVVIPVFTRTVLDSGSTVFGVLFGVIYAGVFAGSLLLNRFESAVAANRGRVIVLGVVAAGVAFSAAAALPARLPAPRIVAAVAFFVAGVFTVCIWVPARTISQEVPDDVRGRVSSVMTTTSTAALPVSIAVVGPAMTVLSASDVLLVEGGLLVVVGVGLALTPLRRADRSTATVES